MRKDHIDALCPGIDCIGKKSCPLSIGLGKKLLQFRIIARSELAGQHHAVINIHLESIHRNIQIGRGNYGRKTSRETDRGFLFQPRNTQNTGNTRVVGECANFEWHAIDEKGGSRVEVYLRQRRSPEAGAGRRPERQIAAHLITGRCFYVGS